MTLFRQAKLSTGRGVTLDEFPKLALLPRFLDYEFRIYMSRPHLHCVKEINSDAHLGPICIYIDDKFHCYLIKSVNALFGKTGRLCSGCNKFFAGDVKSHQCDNFCCKQCKCRCDSFRLPNAVSTIRCEGCLRYFLSQNCHHLHLQRGASRLYKFGVSVCESVMACLTCGRDLKAVGGIRSEKNAYEKSGKNALHVCFKSKCRICSRLDDMSKHTCFI